MAVAYMLARGFDEAGAPAHHRVPWPRLRLLSITHYLHLPFPFLYTVLASHDTFVNHLMLLNQDSVKSIIYIIVFTLAAEIL
jgi:hypothetical protein